MMLSRLDNKFDIHNLEAYWMPFTANRQFKAAPRLFVSAKDMHYTSLDGRRILDGMAGLWCVNAGHCRKKIVEAVAGRARIIFDGGIMRGADVVKAMALGADAVAIGRLQGLGAGAAGAAAAEERVFFGGAVTWMRILAHGWISKGELR